MSEFTKPLKDLAGDAQEYVDMKVEDVKLRTAKGMSVAMNELVAIVLILAVATIVLITLAFAFVLLLGDLVGSYALGAFIVAAFFLVILVVLFTRRKKLFINSFLKTFLNLFFSDEEQIRY